MKWTQGSVVEVSLDSGQKRRGWIVSQSVQFPEVWGVWFGGAVRWFNEKKIVKIA